LPRAGDCDDKAKCWKLQRWKCARGRRRASSSRSIARGRDYSRNLLTRERAAGSTLVSFESRTRGQGWRIKPRTQTSPLFVTRSLISCVGESSWTRERVSGGVPWAYDRSQGVVSVNVVRGRCAGDVGGSNGSRSSVHSTPFCPSLLPPGWTETDREIDS